MTSWSWFTGIVLLVCCLPGYAEQTELERFEAYLDGVMAAQFRDYQLAGVTFALVLDGERVLSRGYGYADLASATPVDPARHLFRPGSVSKLFTWTALMQLVEAGRIDLDAPVSDYITQFQIPDEFGQPLTLKHIMTHTPGFEDGAAGFLFAEDESDLVPLAESLAAHIPNQIWPPGTYAAYNNFAVALAGLAIANVSGMPFEDYIAANIFKPLGMTHSTFDEPLPAALEKDFATGYIEKQGALEPFGFEFIRNFGPAGALSSTADDMARFIIAHVNDGKFGSEHILQTETAQLMHSRLFAHHPEVAGMAYGFYEIRRNGERFVGHAGDTIAFHSELIIKPEDDFGFFISFNAPDGGRARTAVTDSVLDFFYPGADETVPDQPPAGSAERIEKIAGEYRLNRRSYTQLEGLTALAGDLSVAAAEKAGQIFIPAPGIGGRFVEIEPWVFQQVDRQELLVFDTDTEGNVTHAFIGSLPIMVADRLSFTERAATHQIIIVLALLAALFVVINGLRRNPAYRQLTGAVRLARRFALANAWLILIFTAGMAAVMGQADMDRMIFDFPPVGTGVLLVLPVVSLLLVAVCTALLVPVWRGDVCNFWQKLRYTYVTGIFLLLLAVFWYWNLIGWNY